MHKEKVTCREVMNHICDNLGEDLNSPKCIAIKEHLDNCDSCKKFFKSVEDTIKFYKLYNVELPEESHKNLMKKLGLEE